MSWILLWFFIQSDRTSVVINGSISIMRKRVVKLHTEEDKAKYAYGKSLIERSHRASDEVSWKMFEGLRIVKVVKLIVDMDCYRENQ